MSVTNPDKPITKQDLKDFYDSILPYLGSKVHSAFTPVGTIISVMTNACPANYLECNGQVVNIADYPELASHFATQFGSNNCFGGNGTTTFAVPDLRGEFLRGTGTNGHTGQGNGANVGTHQDATVFGQNYINSSSSSFRGIVEGGSTSSIVNEDSSILKNINQATISATGSDFTNIDVATSRPTNTSVFYCIAVKNIFIDGGMNFSEDEQVVGSWIDGKPLYQKTVTGTTNFDGSTAMASFDSTFNIVDLKAYIVAAEKGRQFNPFWYSVNNYWCMRIEDNKLIGNGTTGYYNNKDFVATVRYTKTTD